MSVEECSREDAIKQGNPERLLQMGLTFSFLTATCTGLFQLLKPAGNSIAPFTSNINTIGPILLSGPALLYMLFFGSFPNKCVSGQTAKAGLSHVRQHHSTTKANKGRTEYKSWGSE